MIIQCISLGHVFMLGLSQCVCGLRVLLRLDCRLAILEFEMRTAILASWTATGEISSGRGAPTQSAGVEWLWWGNHLILLRFAMPRSPSPSRPDRGRQNVVSRQVGEVGF